MNTIVKDKPVIDTTLIVEEQKREVCPHKRHRTMKKGLMWKCNRCGLIRVKGLNSQSEEKPNDMPAMQMRRR